MTQHTNFSQLSNIRIVMVNTSHPGNIGAAARAMKNMGLDKLYLVEPKDFPSLEAISRSVGAVGILDKAVVVKDLNAAVSDCVWVAGTSARLRTIEWPIFEPRECVQKGLDNLAQGEIAIVFGNETNGLTNEQLERCNVLLHIPTNPDFSSLNIAAAVQIICYEFRMGLTQAPTLEPAQIPEKKVPVKKTSAKQAAVRSSKHRFDILANATQLEGMYGHIRESLGQLNFFGTKNPDVMMRRIKGLFNRAETTQREVSIIRGICSAIQGKKNSR